MSRFATWMLVLLGVLSVLALAGCGGGGGSVPPPDKAAGQQVFVIDFVRNTVTTAVEPQFMDRNPGAAAAALKLNLTVHAADPGSPGRRSLTARVQNNTPGLVGVNDRGTLTGVDLCMVALSFWNSSDVRVSGGSFWGYDYISPLTGTPVFTIPQKLAGGETSEQRRMDLILPPTATSAKVTILVRADTERGYPPDLTRWYLTTLAGRSGARGFWDGPASLALFHGPTHCLFREDWGDLLIADFGTNRIRRLFQGEVSTFAGTGASTVLSSPKVLALDSAGNVLVSEYGGHCISLVGPAGGTPTVIAGARGTYGDTSDCVGTAARFRGVGGMATSGSRIFVGDIVNQKVKMIAYQGTGSRSDGNNYWVTDITYGLSLLSPYGLAADAFGNVYLVDYARHQLYILPPDASTWTAIAGDGTGATLDGVGTSARFLNPTSIAVDSAGIIYVAEAGYALRRVRHTGGSRTDPSKWRVETLVPRADTAVDGFSGAARVRSLTGVACSRSGTLYLTDDSAIRRLDRTRD